MSTQELTNALEGTAASSTEAAVPQERRKHGKRDGAQPKDGTERLREFRWREGQSGNPEGRKKLLPLSDARIALLEAPLPLKYQKKIAEMFDWELDEKVGRLTWAEGLVLMEFGGQLEHGVNPQTMLEIRRSAEGDSQKRDKNPAQDLDEWLGKVANEPISMRERILMGFARIIMERGEIYGMHDPEVDALFDEARKRAIAIRPTQQ